MICSFCYQNVFIFSIHVFLKCKVKFEFCPWRKMTVFVLENNEKFTCVNQNSQFPISRWLFLSLYYLKVIFQCSNLIYPFLSIVAMPTRLSVFWVSVLEVPVVRVPVLRVSIFRISVYRSLYLGSRSRARMLVTDFSNNVQDIRWKSFIFIQFLFFIHWDWCKGDKARWNGMFTFSEINGYLQSIEPANNGNMDSARLI